MLYATKISGDQGIIADDADGRSVAVTYRAEDAVLLAAAPQLKQALIDLVDCAGLTSLPGYRDELDSAVRAARQVIADTEI